MAGRAQKFAKQAKALAGMAAAGRKPQIGLREPNGRPSRAAKKLLGAENLNEIYRVRAAALSGAGDRRWGTQLGRLFLEGKITGEQYGAGRSWDALVDRWRAIHCGPRFNPKCGLASLLQVNPDDPKQPGRRYEITSDMDNQEAMVTGLINDAMDSFPRGSADPALLAVRECVEQDYAPAGVGGKMLLAEGLNRLAEHWSVEA